MRKALRRLLQTHGYEVVTFRDADALLTVLPGAVFDCLLLDLHMPEMDGFEVLEHLARQGLMLPVIVITAHDEPRTEEQVSRLGAVAYLVKPVEEASLLEAIRRSLPLPNQNGASRC